MNLSQLRFPGGKRHALTLSYDDGVEQDIRLMEILNTHGIRCTFNLNSGCFTPEGTVFAQDQIHRRLTRRAALDLYGLSDHEIALHGYVHADPTELSPEDCLREYQQDRQALEDLFGRIIRGSAYAYGRYNEDVIAVLSALDVVYARTVHSTHAFAIPERFLELHPTCHHDDEKLFDLFDAFLTDTSEAPLLFYLWGHSYEFEQHDNWDRINTFCRLAGGQSSIYYCTNMELYDYVTAFRRLVVSLDQKRIYNPSAIELFFARRDQILHIDAGQTLILS